MNWREAKGRAALRTAVVVALSFSAGMSSAVCGAEDGGAIALRYAPKEGQVLKYKGSTTSEAFFQGNEFMNVHSDIVEISLVKMTEDGKYDVKLNYLESSDKRGMAGSALSDYEGPVRPMGHAIEITVDAMGKVHAANGLLPGLRRGKPTTDYVEKWFAPLPSDTLTQGAVWTMEFPEKDEEQAQEGAGKAENEPSEDEASGLVGTIRFELKKIEKKDGIEVAQIEFKGALELHTKSERGRLDGEVKVDGKAKIAIDGGYIVEYESARDMKGKVVSEDEFSGKETENDVQQTEYVQVKLQK